MAVTVKTLFNNGSFLYKMKLIAGRNGLGKLVQWVHILEDDEASAFLHGGELVFTAGILNRREDWLLSFVKKLLQNGASAFVVNLGPHTKEIPPSVSAACDEAALPLFTIPWETRMVDMTRDFCQRIIQAEQVEESIMTAMKNILFHVGDRDSQVLLMERHGFQRGSQYCFLCVQVGEDTESEEVRTLLKRTAEYKVKEMGGLHVSFTYNGFRIFMLSNFLATDIDAFTGYVIQQIRLRLPGHPLHVGVSPNQPGLCDQAENFEKALAAMDRARKRQEPVVFYERLGLFKVLYAVKDRTVLSEYHHEILGRLEEYDTENGTALVPLLEDYLALEGSLQAVAEKHFVHRNTVTNQLRKVASVTGVDPVLHEGRLSLALALRIREIL